MKCVVCQKEFIRINAKTCSTLCGLVLKKETSFLYKQVHKEELNNKRRLEYGKIREKEILRHRLYRIRDKEFQKLRDKIRDNYGVSITKKMVKWDENKMRYLL